MRALAQLVGGVLGVVECRGQQVWEVLLLVLQGGVGELEREDRVHQPLLRAVVQIANDTPAFLVGRGANTSSAATPRAASVATRRNAACSSANRPRAARLSVFEIAVASSSVNATSRSSMRSGTGPRPALTIIAPQISPSTMIGAPAAAPNPALRPASAIVPGIPVKSSILAGRPVFRTWNRSVGPSNGHWVPASNGCGNSLQAPITVAVAPPGS